MDEAWANHGTDPFLFVNLFNKGRDMSMLLKKSLVAAVVLAMTLFSQDANADEIRISTLAAYDLHEASTDHDRIRIEYIVDGGKMQAVYRNMHLGDAWNVGLDITFNEKVTIQLYHKEPGIIRDKKLGAFTLTTGAIADGESRVHNFTGHGSRYWMAVGRGNFDPPKHPPLPTRPVKPPAMQDGGTFETAMAASEAGRELVKIGRAQSFRVFEIRKYVDNLGNYLIFWRMTYRPVSNS